MDGSADEQPAQLRSQTGRQSPGSGQLGGSFPEPSPQTPPKPGIAKRKEKGKKSVELKERIKKVRPLF